jgi:hypothetical protein
MRRSVHRSVWLLAALLALPAAVACSKETPTTKMSNDDAVALLEQQGYTERAAQCVIDGALHQNVDIYTFLDSDQATQHDLAVVTSVGAFCAKEFGTTGTSVPGAAGGSTSLAPG